MHCTCEGLSSMRLLAGRSACLNLAHRGLLGISHAAVVILDSWPTVVVGHVMETKASVSHRSPINSYVARPLDRLPPRLLARPHLFPSARVVFQICLPSVIIPPLSYPMGAAPVGSRLFLPPTAIPNPLSWLMVVSNLSRSIA